MSTSQPFLNMSADNLSSLLQLREWENPIQNTNDLGYIERVVHEQLDSILCQRYEVLFSWPDQLNDPYEPAIDLDDGRASVFFRTVFAGLMCEFRIEFFVSRGGRASDIAIRVARYIIDHFSAWKEQGLRHHERYERELTGILSSELRQRVFVSVWYSHRSYNPFSFVVEVSIGDWRTVKEVDARDMGDSRLARFLIDSYYRDNRSHNFYNYWPEIDVSNNEDFSVWETVWFTLRNESANRKNEKARNLLLLYLDDKQRQEYEERETITCIGNVTGNTYRILPKSQINIEIVDNQSNHSRGKSKACVVPEKTMPIEDHMLGQLLLIQNSEELFLDKAIYW